MKRTKIAQVLKGDFIDQKVLVAGWVRTKRASKNVAFVALNDGSAIQNIQIVFDNENLDLDELKEVNTGACISVSGQVAASGGKGQQVEVIAEALEVVGLADPEEYPLQPKRHSLEFLREIAHLRPRTNTFGAINRVRHALIMAIHNFFDSRGFVNVHTPIITGSDAEGAGELFRVTTLDLKNTPLDDNGEPDNSRDFFGVEANLTVSGQLEAELVALAMSEVYTFGPTFRAENSHTTRHLAEFWMIEPEMAFYDLNDCMDLGEDMLKSIVREVRERCPDDLDFLNIRYQEEENQKKQPDRSELTLLEKLEFVVDNRFARIPYEEALSILKNSQPNRKRKFEFPLQGWGDDFQSEHERYLVEKHFKTPVILYDYPKEIKAFYMRQNEDGRSVAAMDILFPGIGEIIGGSQREERYDRLQARVKELEIPEKSLWWYLDTRKFGTAPHSGFGLGFERLMQFITGMGNIRDVIPFPRTPNNAEF